MRRGYSLPALGGTFGAIVGAIVGAVVGAGDGAEDDAFGDAVPDGHVGHVNTPASPSSIGGSCQPGGADDGDDVG